MATEQFRQKILVNRNLPISQRSQFPIVIIDDYDLMPQVRQARTRHQTHIARTYDCDAHTMSILYPCGVDRNTHSGHAQ